MRREPAWVGALARELVARPVPAEFEGRRAELLTGALFLLALRCYHAEIAGLERLYEEMADVAARLDAARVAVDAWAVHVEQTARDYARAKEE